MKNDKSNSPWKTLLKLTPFIKPHGFWVAIAVLCSLCNAILNIAFAYVTKNLTDNALNAQYDEFLQLIYLTSVLVAVGMIVAYFSTYVITRYKTQTTRDLRNHITGHIQRLPVSHIEVHHTGDIVSRLNTDVEKTAGLIGGIPNYVYQPLLFIGASTYMLLIRVLC